MNLMDVLRPTRPTITWAAERYRRYCDNAAKARAEHTLQAAMRRTALQSSILQALSVRPGQTNAELAASIRASARQVRTACRELHAAKLLQFHGQSGWRLA